MRARYQLAVGTLPVGFAFASFLPLGLSASFLYRGIFAWGVPMFIALHIVPTLTKAHAFTVGTVVFQIALWSVAGAAFGAVIWCISEANFRNLERRE